MAPLGKMKTKRSRACIGCCYYTAQCMYKGSSSCTIFGTRGKSMYLKTYYKLYIAGFIYKDFLLVSNLLQSF